MWGIVKETDRRMVVGLLHLIWLIDFFDSATCLSASLRQVFNFGGNWSSDADELCDHDNPNIGRRFCSDLVSPNAVRSEHWRDNDHEKIPQLYGCWIFHGRSCSDVTTLLHALFGVSQHFKK